MGSWGSNSFQNDWALDWLGDLCESEDVSLIRATLAYVVKHGGTKITPPSFFERLRGRRHHIDWLDADVASKALAAAEIIAAWLGYPPAALPDNAMVWLNRHLASFEQDLVPLAKQAVGIIKTNSELKDFYEEGDASEWRDVIADLERRLNLTPAI